MSSPGPEGTRPSPPSTAGSVHARGATEPGREIDSMNDPLNNSVNDSVNGSLTGRSDASGEGGTALTRCLLAHPQQVAEGPGAPESAGEKHPWWQVTWAVRGTCEDSSPHRWVPHPTESATW